MNKEELHNQMLNDFRKYLAETPKDKIEVEIDRIRKMNFPGPTVEQYFEMLNGMNNIEAPFTQEEVDCINRFQQSNQFHPYTYCSYNIPECQRKSGENKGILIANTDGLTCPCGKYKQDWVTEYMSKYE